MIALCDTGLINLKSLQRAFEQQAEAIYNGIMKQLLRQPE